MHMLRRALLPGLLVLLCGSAPTAGAVEAYDGPPARTAAGQTNLTHVWTEKGGARLYWNTLVDPRQIRMAGARFDDPAAVPELRLAPPTVKPAPRHYRNSRKKVQVHKATPAVAAPKGVGSAKLTPPTGKKAGSGAAAPAFGTDPGPASGFGPGPDGNATPGASTSGALPLPYSPPTPSLAGAAAPTAASVSATSPISDARSAGAVVPPLTAGQTGAAVR